MNNKTTIPKTDRIKEIQITKKITKNDSEQYITVQIKYSNITVEEILQKAVAVAKPAQVQDSRKGPGIL